jgi:3-hydroxy-9,10-secoandrosta-1,3,5(10)-triene-9,17-dione monooxygenase reductase component
MSSEGSQERFAPVTSEEFRRACGRFATGVSIATAVDDGGIPHGLTVSSFTSVSLDPPLVLICLGHRVTVIDMFRRAKYFGINVLGADQQELSDRFARKGEDRFSGLAWQVGQTGVPLLPGSIAHIECAVHQRFTSGDHDIFVGEMVRAEVADGDPLIYWASRYCHLA